MNQFITAALPPSVRRLIQTDLRAQRRLSLLFCLALSGTVWWIFFPAVFSRDSFYMLLDATRQKFSDMHPLLIPVLLAFVLRLGGKVGLVTLMQIMLGFLGVRRLISVLARYAGAPRQSIQAMVVLVLAVLASPLTPLSIFLSTLWSDTWLAILLLWISALLLEWNEHPVVSLPRTAQTVVMVGLITLLILVRYNAILVYPCLAWALISVLARRGSTPASSLTIASMPLLLSASFLLVQYRVHNIEGRHPERAVYALDFASMVLYDPSICRDLSLQGCDAILTDFSPAFRVGDGAIDLTFSQANEFQYAPFLSLFYYPRLERELIAAAVAHPQLFLTVKLLNFEDYISQDPHQYFFQNRLIPADVSQLPNQAFALPDNRWFLAARQVQWNPVLSWFSYVHAPWLLLNLGGLLALGVAVVADARRGLLFLWQLLLAPGAYYAAHLVALTTSEFRFMYPATLLMQVSTLTAVLSVCARWLARDRARQRI